MIGLLILGGAAIASTSALIYDWFSDKKEQPTVIINTETAYTGESSKLSAKNLLIGVALVMAFYGAYRHIWKKR